MHMLRLFFSVSGEFQAPPTGWNMNYSVLSCFQWIRLDADILEMMLRKTEEKKRLFGCVWMKPKRHIAGVNKQRWRKDDPSLR